MEDVKLFLKHYCISELNLKLNPNFTQTNSPISIDPKFSRIIQKIDDDNAIVAIKVLIDDKGNKPFIGTIVIQGMFKCANWESSEDGKFHMADTASMVLFPYLRQALSTATTMLNVPPYVLPIVNVSSLFNIGD